MKNIIKLLSYKFLILIIWGLVSCSSAETSQPEVIIEKYFHALVEKDYAKMVNYSCAEWESQAKTEYDSFTAVSITLKDLKCNYDEKVGENVLVQCNGKITANYGNEILEIDLSDQNYVCVFENGAWRMCGYK